MPASMMPASFARRLFAIGLLAVAGCGSSPPVRFFALEPLTADFSNAEPALVVGLGPLRVADYLDRPQLVTRGSDSEIVIDELNRWAEPLGPAIHRTLASNVDGLLDDVSVVGFPDTDTASIDYRVAGRINRLDVDGAGLAVLEVQWRVESADGEDLTMPRRARYSTRIDRPGDPASIAESINDTLAQFSRDIAATVQEISGAR